MTNKKKKKIDCENLHFLIPFLYIHKKYFWVVPTALDFFDFEGVLDTKYFCLSYPIKNIFNISLFWLFRRRSTFLILRGYRKQNIFLVFCFGHSIKNIFLVFYFFLSVI